MNNQNYYSPRTNLDKRQRLMILAGIGVVVLILVWVAFSLISQSQKRDPRQLATTELLAGRNFGHISGSDVYGFNGMAFYKRDVKSGQTTVLNSGVKLPVPERMFWADSKGVLVSFSHSFWATLPERVLNSQKNSAYTRGEDYVWYYDFATSNITLVSQAPLRPSAVHYSAEKNGFYYVPDYRQMGELDRPGFDAAKSSLVFFDINSGKNQTIADDLAVIDISKVSDCPSKEDSACLVGREEASPEKIKLFAVSPNGNKRILLESNGRLIPTNRPELYITTNQKEPEGPKGDQPKTGEETEVFEQAPGRLNNLSTNKQSKLRVNIGEGDIQAHFADDGSFYLIDSSLVKRNRNQQNEYEYWEGEWSNGGQNISVRKLPLGGKDRFTSRLGSPASHGSGGLALFTSSDGKQVIFGSDQPIGFPGALAEQDILQQLAPCKNLAEDMEYIDSDQQTRIFFKQNDSLQTNIKKFADCAIQNQELLFGSNYNFVTVSPRDGRITSD